MGVAPRVLKIRSVEESGRARKRSFENIMAFKLKVVACAEGESSRGAARRFGVDEKRVREWRKNNYIEIKRQK